MVDIKELMQTYVFLNDPNVKEITTKFGMVVLGLGLATLGIWGAVTLVQGGPGAADTTAGTADDGGSQAGADTTKDCVRAEDADAWRAEHASIVSSDRLLDVEASGDWVCFTYTE